MYVSFIGFSSGKHRNSFEKFQATNFCFLEQVDNFIYFVMMNIVKYAALKTMCLLILINIRDRSQMNQIQIQFFVQDFCYKPKLR